MTVLVSIKPIVTMTIPFMHICFHPPPRKCGSFMAWRFDTKWLEWHDLDLSLICFLLLHLWLATSTRSLTNPNRGCSHFPHIVWSSYDYLKVDVLVLVKWSHRSPTLLQLCCISMRWVSYFEHIQFLVNMCLFFLLYLWLEPCRFFLSIQRCIPLRKWKWNMIPIQTCGVWLLVEYVCFQLPSWKRVSSCTKPPSWVENGCIKPIQEAPALKPSPPQS